MFKTLADAIKNNPEDLPIWSVAFDTDTHYVPAKSKHQASRVLFDKLHASTKRIKQVEIYAHLKMMVQSDGSDE